MKFEDSARAQRLIQAATWLRLHGETGDAQTLIHASQSMVTDRSLVHRAEIPAPSSQKMRQPLGDLLPAWLSRRVPVARRWLAIGRNRRYTLLATTLMSAVFVWASSPASVVLPSPPGQRTQWIRIRSFPEGATVQSPRGEVLGRTPLSVEAPLFSPLPFFLTLEGHHATPALPDPQAVLLLPNENVLRPPVAKTLTQRATSKRSPSHAKPNDVLDPYAP